MIVKDKSNIKSYSIELYGKGYTISIFSISQTQKSKLKNII